MPDGGSDCCGTCVLNANWGRYMNPDLAGERPRVAVCLLRGISTGDPFWTYCDWHNGGPFSDVTWRMLSGRAHPYAVPAELVDDLLARILQYHSRRRESFTAVWASGIYSDGYQRIPWDGPADPVVVSADHAQPCDRCGAAATGHALFIHPEDSKEPLFFCSNEHYLDWWKPRHPNTPHWFPAVPHILYDED